MTFKEYLNRAEVRACSDATKWAADKPFKEIYKTCKRGDWLCWLFVRTNPEDIRALTLVKGLQANEVRHLMRNPRSIAAVDSAIAFGRGEISRYEVNASAYAADSAAYAAASASSAYAAFASSAYAAKKSLSRSADIFRENIPYDKINRVWETM